MREFATELSDDFAVRDDEAVAVVENETDFVKVSTGHCVSEKDASVFNCVVSGGFNQFRVSWHVFKPLRLRWWSEL